MIPVSSWADCQKGALYETSCRKIDTIFACLPVRSFLFWFTPILTTSKPVSDHIYEELHQKSAIMKNKKMPISIQVRLFFSSKSLSWWRLKEISFKRHKAHFANHCLGLSCWEWIVQQCDVICHVPEAINRCCTHRDPSQSNAQTPPTFYHKLAGRASLKMELEFCCKDCHALNWFLPPTVQITVPNDWLRYHSTSTSRNMRICWQVIHLWKWKG